MRCMWESEVRHRHKHVCATTCLYNLMYPYVYLDIKIQWDSMCEVYKHNVCLRCHLDNDGLHRHYQYWSRAWATVCQVQKQPKYNVYRQKQCWSNRNSRSTWLIWDKPWLLLDSPRETPDNALYVVKIYTPRRIIITPPLGPKGGVGQAPFVRPQGVAKKSKILKMFQPAGCLAKSFKKVKSWKCSNRPDA